MGQPETRGGVSGAGRSLQRAQFAEAYAPLFSIQVNQDDVHPMIGETAVGGLWACNGFSGHGFKLAPAVGSLVAQQVTGLKTDAWETSMPTDFMGPYREPLKLKQKTHFA